jgi:predicted RNA methylase
MSNMQEKLKSLQNIMSQRGYNKSASTARENTDLKSNLKSLQDILVKRGYTPKSVPSEQKSKTRHKEKGNNLFEETSKSTFETMPKYQENKQKFENETINKFKEKYGKELEDFSQQDYYDWATSHGFKFVHQEQAGISENPIMGTKNSEEDKKEEKNLRYLLQFNQRRKELESEEYDTAKSFGTGIRNSVTFNTFPRLEEWADQKDINAQNSPYAQVLKNKYKTKVTDEEEKVKEEHPIANTVGYSAGELAKWLTTRKVASKAVGSVKWLANKPQWLQNTVKNGIIDGITSGFINAANTAGGGGDAKTIAKQAGIGAVGGSLGGAASSLVGEFGENILFKRQLQHKFIPEMARNVAASVAFAGADSAATYFLYPKEERPTALDIAKNMGVTFAFAAITTALNVGAIKQSSKEVLDVLNDEMIKDYEGMAHSANKNDKVSVKQFAKNVMNYSDSMIKYLNGEEFELKNDAPSDTVTKYLTGGESVSVKNTVLKKARFVGEDARVRSMQEDLRTIKSRAKEIYDRADSIPYDVEKKSETSNVGNVDNITKEPTNINNANSTLQNKNSIQNVPKTSEVEPIQTVQEQTPISVKTNDVEVQKTDKLPKEVQDSVSKADVVAENNPQGYNKDFVRRYANSFVEVAQKSDNYPNRDFLDNNIADELTQKILTGESKLDGNSDFDYAVKQFKFILNQADESKLNQVQQFNENQKQQNDVSASEINTDNSIINDTVDGVNSADTPTTTDTVFNDTQENGVQPSVNRVTEEVHNAMNKVGLNVSESATGIQEANTKFMSNNDNLFDRNYVSNYANDFVQAMSEKNGRSYTVLSQETDNLADELVNKTLTGNSVLDGNREFQTVVRNFKDILREGIKKNTNLHNNVYGANEVLNAQVQDIENGDYSSLNISENANNNIKFAPVSENGQNVGYVIEQGIDYTNQLSETSFAVKQKNGEYETKQGVTYGRFGTHQSSNGSYIVSYLPTGNATAILPNQDTAIEFMKQVENETSGYSIYLHNDNDGITKTGGEISQFINALNAIKSNLQVKENSAKEMVSANPLAAPVENATQKDNSTIEIPKSDIKTNETLPVGQLLEDYNDTVDNILSVSDETAKELADNRVAVEILKNTPNVILDNVKGARDLKVIINYTKLYLAVRKNGVFEGHYHNLGAEIAKKLPDFLQNPDAIIQLANGKLNLFTTVKTKKGNNGIISVELNSTKDIGGKNEDYNVVVTMFSSNDNYTKNLISGEGVNIKYKKEDLSQVNPQLYKWLATINDKSSTNNIVSQDSDVVNSSIRRDTENDTLNLKDKCNLTQTKHTKTGEDLWVIGLKERISADEYKKLNAKVKAVGGYYSRYAKTPDGKSIPGFIFKSEPTEEVFDVFNDFFKTTGTLKKTDDVQVGENVKDSQSTNNNAESDKENISENNKTVLNSQSENDTIKEKPDLEIGDVIEYDGKQWEVTQTGLNMSFKNLDKSDSKQTFSHIGGIENFKQTHDYKMISKADNQENGGKENGISQQVANFVEEKLQKGEKFTSDMLFKKTGEIYDGSLADNTFTVKDAYDAMELGINQYILNMKEEPTLDKMFEIIDKIPTQTKRTEGMDNYQQFSTPPTLAYLASYAANINSNDIMLEPSAGIGGIATFAKKSGAKVIVNELDPRRMAILKNMPFDDFYSEDAEQINNILGGDIEPSVVVMNPPFSSSTTRNMKGAKIGAKHIEEALKMLKTNGRLVAITGKTMADDAPTFRNWWNDIKKKYNVVANIGISGKNFNKYGTNFGIQMMVIDNNGATKNTITDYVEDLHDLQSILGGIRNERPILDYSANEQRATTTTRKEIATTRTKGSVGGGTVSDTSSGIDTEQSSNKGRVPKHRDAENEVLRNDGSGGNTVNQRADKPNELDDERRLDERRKPRGNDELQDTGGTDKSDSVEHSVQSGYGGNEKNDGLRQNGVGVQRLKKKELTDNVFEEYKVAPLKVKNAKPHPAKLSESAAMSAVKAPDITYKPHIDQKLIDEGTLSSAQLEVVSRAGQCHSQTLPNGETRGFFCGDGTGVGKGRTVAGIILDNFNQGRKKAVWISKGHDLLKDTLDYTKDVFGRNDMVVEFNGGKKADSSLKSDDTILYLTYNKLSQGWNKENSNFEKIVSWLGKDFDGVIAFDEAHMMSNAGGKVTNRGKAKPSETALAGIELQKLLPKAKVIYMSATGATEVENLQYATRLGLWGEGTAFPNEKEFISQIKGGGISAMEMLAQDLKMEGVYLSRNISYEDVTYDKLTHKLTKEQKKMYNTVAKAWQIVFQNLNEALKETHQSSDGTARGQVYGKFWSSNQRFFNQILVSMQTPSVIKDIEKQLAKGKSCIIQLTSTNEAQGKRELARLYEEGLTLDDYDVSPKQMLMEYVEKSFPVQQYEEYKDEKGNVKSKPVYNSKGEPVLNREAVRKRDTLLDQLGSMKAPSSPIDMIINAFGTDLVAENTGRSSRVINVDGKNVQQRLSNNTRSADVEAFQNGKKRIMIFSEAGGTGKSYHASKAAKNQQQRVHYLLEAGWKASTAVQGFGRSHRSNQVSAPIFKLVTTDLKGQSRFISTIAKRLAQLGSLTKGQRQAGSQGMFSEDDNLENAFSATVLKSYITALAKGGINDITNGKEIISKLGLNVYNSDGSINQNSDDLTSINKFLNRILSLEYDEQNEVFDEFDSQLKMATAEAEQNGTLDKGMENYKADKVSVKETKTVHTDKLSGAETLYYSLVADKKIKKNEFSDIQSDSPRFKGFYQNKSNGGVRAITQIANKTDSNGNVVSRFKAEGQEYGKTVYLSEQQVSQRWNKIDNETAKVLWNKRLEEMPEYRQENVHLISGAVLPVWDKLPETNIKVYRILTDNGDVLIGRVISENAIDSILRRLGANRIKDKVDVSSIIDTVKSGDIVYLENGWSLKQSRVANEQRIELTGPRFDDYDFVKKLGVFSERISFQTRFFIPTKTNTENIIDKLVQYSPYDRTETRYSKGDDSNGWEVKKPEQEKQIENVEDDNKKTSDKSNADIRYSKQANNLDSWTSDVKQSSKNQKNKKLGDIVSYISKKFNIPISKGNLSLTRAKGEFKKLPKAVRLRIANDLPTATHELGHLLDDEYDFTSSANIDEIIDFAQRKSPTLMKQYKKSEVPDEAVAEFVREFVKDPQSTIKEVPKFSKEFIETLSPKDAQALKTLSEYSQQYYNSDFMDKVDAAMTNNKEIKKRSKSTASEISKEIYTKLVDSFAPIKEATDYVKEVKGTLSGKKDAYILAINSKNVDATMSTIFKEGMVDPNGNLTGGKGLIDCIKDISHKDIDLFDKYLVLKHSLEWIEPQEGAKLKRVFSDDTLQNSERIKREIANLENSHPEFKEASENLYKFQQDMLKYWVVSMGGMDAITYNKLQKMYPHYVPFMRDTGRNRTGFKSSFANQQSPVKTAKGSGATIISPLESIIKNVEKQVKFGTRNRVMAVLGMYADNVPGFANFIEPVPPDQVKNIINIEKLSDEFLGRMSESLDENDLFNLTEVFEDVFGTQVESYTPVVIPGKQIVTYLNKGKHKYYQVHDKALFNAITNLTPVQTEKIMNFAGRTLGITNALITQLNPVFATTNAIRDYDTAMKNSKAYNNPITFTGAYMSALWDVIRNSDNYKQYKAAGGGHMSMFSDNIDVLKKTLREVNSKDAGLARRLAQAIFLHPIECVTKINEITEAIPRLAEFKGMKKKGADNQQAIYAASDITVNFNRSGDVGRKLNKIFRFSNATVQGMDKQARIFTSGGKKEIAKHMLRYLISAILTTALLEFWNRTSDEDGWEELSQYQKNNFYCISIGNGKFIKIPKAREAAILNTTAERAADYAFGDKEAFYQFGQYIGDTTLPAWLPVTGIAEGGIEEGVHQAAGGTILGGIVDNMVNKDFKGTPIVSSALEDEPNKEQYNQKTSLLAKSIGQTFNWSPMKIDHLIDNYTGIIGKLNRSVTADGFNPSNLYGTSFSADSVYSTDVFNRVYEQRDKMQKKYQNEPTPQNACLYEKYATKAAYITQANKAIKRLSEDEQRTARKELITDIKATGSAITDTDKGIVNSFSNGLLTSDNGYVDSLPKSTITKTKNKQSYTWEMTYSEYKKYYDDYRKEVEKQRKKLLNTSAYKRASDIEKTEML